MITFKMKHLDVFCMVESMETFHYNKLNSPSQPQQANWALEIIILISYTKNPLVQEESGKSNAY